MIPLGTYDNVSCIVCRCGNASFSEQNFTRNVKIHGLPFTSDTMLFGKK
jgi:hypothetical protein